MRTSQFAIPSKHFCLQRAQKRQKEIKDLFGHPSDQKMARILAGRGVGKTAKDDGVVNELTKVCGEGGGTQLALAEGLINNVL